jgi:Transposase/Transposase IS116/IS110/IS902 family
MSDPPAPRSVFPWCGRARDLVGPGVPRSPPLEPRDGNVPGARFVEFIFVRSPTPTVLAWRGGTNGSQHERVAGLDVHKAMIVACVRIMPAGKIKRECRTFETSTASLDALLGWLTASGCTHVAMEATGVYWKPVCGAMPWAKRSRRSMRRSIPPSLGWTREVQAGQATFRSLILLLCSVPGINVLGATIILAEIGRDMSRFPTAGHLLA